CVGELPDAIAARQAELLEHRRGYRLVAATRPGAGVPWLRHGGGHARCLRRKPAYPDAAELPVDRQGRVRTRGGAHELGPGPAAARPRAGAGRQPASRPDRQRHQRRDLALPLSQLVEAQALRDGRAAGGRPRAARRLAGAAACAERAVAGGDCESADGVIPVKAGVTTGAPSSASQRSTASSTPQTASKSASSIHGLLPTVRLRAAKSRARGTSAAGTTPAREG